MSCSHDTRGRIRHNPNPVEDHECRHCGETGMRYQGRRNKPTGIRLIYKCIHCDRTSSNPESGLRTSSRVEVDGQCRKCGDNLVYALENPGRSRINRKGVCVNGHRTYIESRPMTDEELKADHHTFRAPLPQYKDCEVAPISVETMRTWFRWQSVRMSA